MPIWEFPENVVIWHHHWGLLALRKRIWVVWMLKCWGFWNVLLSIKWRGLLFLEDRTLQIEIGLHLLTAQRLIMTHIVVVNHHFWCLLPDSIITLLNKHEVAVHLSTKSWEASLLVNYVHILELGDIVICGETDCASLGEILKPGRELVFLVSVIMVVRAMGFLTTVAVETGF